MIAFPALLALGFPISPVIHSPISAIASKSTPVFIPRLSRKYSTSSVATFPVAPGLYGQPPRPPTLESNVRIPCSKLTIVLTSAWPYVSWKCIAISSFRMPAACIAFNKFLVLGAVPIPVVSPISISSAPISRRSVAISATRRGSTSRPSKGHPNATEMYARTRRPAALAPRITSLNRNNEVSISQFKFFCVKLSVAAAKTDISM